MTGRSPVTLSETNCWSPTGIIGPKKPKRNRVGVSCAPLAVALSVMPRKPCLVEIDESALECVRTRDMCSRTEMKTKIDDEIALDRSGSRDRRDGERREGDD